MAKKTIGELLSKLEEEVDGLRNPSDLNPFNDVDSWAATGSPKLDEVLDTLGLPTGMIELSGKSRSGKTTLAMSGARGFLQSNETGIVIVAYSERRYNTDYLYDMGLDMDRVRVLDFKYVEDMYRKLKVIIDKVRAMFQEHGLGIPKFYVVWDSVSSTVSEEEMAAYEENIIKQDKKGGESLSKKESKNTSLGSFAKAAKAGAKYFLTEVYESSLHFVCISHTMTDLKSPVGKRKSSGGEWLEYMPTMRLELSKIGLIKPSGVTKAVGQRTKIRVHKNDFGIPEKEVEVSICFGRGFALDNDELEIGVEEGLLMKKGHGYTSTKFDVSWGSEKELFNLYIKRNPNILKLRDAISEVVHNQIIEKRSKSLRNVDSKNVSNSVATNKKIVRKK